MIVYIVTKLELGGAQKVCLALMQGLTHQQFPVSLISGAEGVLVQEAQKFQSTYLLPSLKRELSLAGIFAEVKTFFTLVKILKELKKAHPFLVVHTHSTKAGIIGRWAAYFVRIPHRVHTVHGFGFHAYQSWLKWVCIFLCEYFTSFITTHFVCVSKRDQKVGAKFFPGFAKKSSIIRAAVDQQRFVSMGIRGSSYGQKNTCTIGTIACFKPQKNLFDLLQAFKLVHDTCIGLGEAAPHLQIIGDGQQREQLETWIRQEKLTRAITLLGWQKDVSAWMKNWDLFCLSSLWEGLPCAIIEARLCKLPIVSYAVDGIPEVIMHGKNGLLAKPGDWRELASYMIKIIHNKELHKKLSTYQDNFYDFDNKTMVNKHLALYSSWKSSPFQRS